LLPVEAEADALTLAAEVLVVCLLDMQALLQALPTLLR
jgi:hypothetical protein